MDKFTLKQKVERRKKWMNNDEVTIRARAKLCTGQILTIEESQKLFKYLRKLESSLDNIIDA